MGRDILFNSLTDAGMFAPAPKDGRVVCGGGVFLKQRAQLISCPILCCSGTSAGGRGPSQILSPNRWARSECGRYSSGLLTTSSHVPFRPNARKQTFAEAGAEFDPITSQRPQGVPKQAPSPSPYAQMQPPGTTAPLQPGGGGHFNGGGFPAQPMAFLNMPPPGVAAPFLDPFTLQTQDPFAPRDDAGDPFKVSTPDTVQHNPGFGSRPNGDRSTLFEEEKARRKSQEVRLSAQRCLLFLCPLPHFCTTILQILNSLAPTAKGGGVQEEMVIITVYNRSRELPI